MKDILNSYVIGARVFPAFVVLMPIILYTQLWFPELQSRAGVIGSLIVSLGGLLLLAQLSRDAGKKLEVLLFQEWGGPPTTAILRHRDITIDKITKERYYHYLSGNVPNLNIPAPVEEYTDPQSADVVYESATTWLRTQTRDTAKFPMVFQENVNYGFRRNLWGIRGYGITSTLLALLANGFSIYLYFVHQIKLIPLELGIVSLVISLLMTIFWIFWVTPNWVKIPAYAYAKELLACCDNPNMQRQP